MPSTRRCGPPFSTPAAASSTAPSLFLRVDGREGEPHRVALAGFAATAGRSRPRSRRDVVAPARAFEAGDYDELVDHRSSSGASGAAPSRPAAWRTSSWSPARCPISTASGCWPTRAHLRGADRVLARRGRQAAVRALPVPAQRGRGRSRRARAPREHGADRAAPRPAAQAPTPRSKSGEPGDGYVNLLGLVSHEYFHAWNVKRLMPREFARSTTRARTTPGCSGSSRASRRTTTICSCCAAA